MNLKHFCIKGLRRPLTVLEEGIRHSKIDILPFSRKVTGRTPSTVNSALKQKVAVCDTEHAKNCMVSRPAPGRRYTCCAGIPNYARGAGHGYSKYF